MQGSLSQVEGTTCFSSSISSLQQWLPLGLVCDVSAYGIGAILSHTMPNGSERPIAYGSRTLSKAEQHYSQIEKEALGLIFGVNVSPISL